MHALSAKVAAGEFIVVDLGKLKELKTSELAKKINELGWKRALVIDGASVNPNLAKAAKNISGICLLYTSPSPRDGLLSRMPSSA